MHVTLCHRVVGSQRTETWPQGGAGRRMSVVSALQSWGMKWEEGCSG